MDKIYIVNFTDTLLKQDFYKALDYEIIDVSDLEGVNCYCDNDAFENLDEMLEKVPTRALHFIDSGNYHYLSLLFLKRIKEDFSLLVYDKHTDMQDSAFGNILSCGSWILAALRELPHLKEIRIAGADEKLVKISESELMPSFKDCSFNYENNIFSIRKKDCPEGLPLYLSIDKDVLSTDYALTDWDQGEMTVKELFLSLDMLLSHRLLLGIDVCGDGANRDLHEKSHEINSKTNKLLTKELIARLK